MLPSARLRKWRGKRSLLQASRVLDVDPTHVRKLEMGLVYDPGVRLAIRLRDLCGIAIDDWLRVRRPNG